MVETRFDVVLELIELRKIQAASKLSESKRQERKLANIHSFATN
jgi:hypothetical protein